MCYYLQLWPVESSSREVFCGILQLQALSQKSEPQAVSIAQELMF